MRRIVTKRAMRMRIVIRRVIKEGRKEWLKEESKIHGKSGRRIDTRSTCDVPIWRVFLLLVWEKEKNSWIGRYRRNLHVRILMTRLIFFFRPQKRSPGMILPTTMYTDWRYTTNDLNALSIQIMWVGAGKNIRIWWPGLSTLYLQIPVLHYTLPWHEERDMNTWRTSPTRNFSSLSMQRHLLEADM